MKILMLKKSVLSKVASSITMVALLLVTSFGPHLAEALAITTSKDTATRLQISTTADHVVTFTLPTGIDFDSTGTTDFLRVDFPTTFAQGGTWQTTDFAFTDSVGSRTIQAVSAGAATVDCTVSAGTSNVCVAIDTTNMIFSIKPSSTYTASATGSAVTFTIFGTTTTGTGTFTNPSSVAATNIDFQMCDNVAACDSAFTTSHSSQVAYGIIDDDTVAITASVNSSITFDMDTTASDTCSTTETAAPYAVALGSITSADTRVSGATDTVNHICIDLDTNASGGAVVTVNNTNGVNGLVSTSTPADNISSSTAGVADNTENYGICVVSVSDASGTLAIAGTYIGNTCAANSETNQVDALSATPVSILDTASAPIATGRAQIAVNASINIAQQSHNDYTDALTFIATATF